MGPHLQNRHQYSVYTTLLPDLADYHKEKFGNFTRMDLETYKKLFELVNGLMLLVTDCCVVSCRVVCQITLARHDTTSPKHRQDGLKVCYFPVNSVKLSPNESDNVKVNMQSPGK